MLIRTENDEDADDIEIQRFEADDGNATGFITGGYRAELTIRQKDSLKKIKLNQLTSKQGPHLNFLELAADEARNKNHHDLIMNQTSKLGSNNFVRGIE